MRLSASRGVLLALLLVAPVARADHGDAIASGIGQGILMGAIGGGDSPPPAPGLYRPELADWVDPQSGSTSRMSAGCGVVVQTTLTGSATKNFLNVIVSNQSAGPVVLDGASVEFASGVRRRFSGASIAVPKKSWIPATLAFEDKRDFAAQPWLELGLVFQSRGRSCSLRLRHERAPGVAADPRTAFEYSSAQIWFGAGVSFAATGGLEALHGPWGPALASGMFVFPWIHHGFGLEIWAEVYDSNSAARIAPGRRFEDHLSVSGTGLTLGYAVRFYPLRWLSLSYAPTVGGMLFDLEEANEVQQSALTFAVRQRLQLEARFVSFDDGSDLYLAPALVQTLVPSGALGQAPLRGSHLSGLLLLTIGG